MKYTNIPAVAAQNKRKAAKIAWKNRKGAKRRDGKAHT